MSYTLTELRTAIQDYTENDETTFLNNLTNFITTCEERILKNVQLSLFKKNVSGTTTSGNKYLGAPSDFLTPISLALTVSSEHTFLDFKDADFVQSFTPNPATTGTPRYYAVFDVDTFILGPTPNANLTAELHYYYRPTSLTLSTITFTVTSSSSFTVGETITGGTSGSTTTISSIPSSTTMTVIVPQNAFTALETITWGTSSASTSLVSFTSDTTTTWLSKNGTVALLYGSLIEAYTYMKGEADVLQNYEKRFAEAIASLKMFGESKEVTDQYRTGQVVRPKQ